MSILQELLALREECDCHNIDEIVNDLTDQFSGGDEYPSNEDRDKLIMAALKRHKISSKDRDAVYREVFARLSTN